MLTRWLFLRLLGVIFFVAFLSLWTQIGGLLGDRGILPVHEFLEAVGAWSARNGIGLDRFQLAPTLCWISDSETFLNVLCAGGAVLSLLLVLGIAEAAAVFLLWAFYLSLVTVGREFLSFQWDALLLETAFLAILLAPTRLSLQPAVVAAKTGWWGRLVPSARVWADPPPSRAVVWLLRWLLFRLMFSSGIGKLASGDATWRDLTALTYHYETQPLPTWIGWYAHQLPLWFHKGSAVFVLAVEIVVPFLIFGPRRVRQLACGSLIALQLLMMVTGNFAFFNVLTIALCVLVLDDYSVARMLSREWRDRGDAGTGRSWPRWVVTPVTVVIIVLSTMTLSNAFRRPVSWPTPMVVLYELVAPFRTVSSYGLFTVMTTTRPEIIVEGSLDGQNWRAYEFKYKAGDPARRPGFVAPHQPRLDWQMWFAALGRCEENPWIVRICSRLLEGSPDVRGLLRYDPFPDAPPRLVRAVLYDYRFTDLATQRVQGLWWRREREGLYCPVFPLQGPPGGGHSNGPVSR